MILIHPTVTSSPYQIALLMERTGMVAQFDFDLSGRAVGTLVDHQPGRTAMESEQSEQEHLSESATAFVRSQCERQWHVFRSLHNPYPASCPKYHVWNEQAQRLREQHRPANNRQPQ